MSDVKPNIVVATYTDAETGYEVYQHVTGRTLPASCNKYFVLHLHQQYSHNVKEPVGKYHLLQQTFAMSVHTAPYHSSQDLTTTGKAIVMMQCSSVWHVQELICSKDRQLR